jgi:hypothetical protein
VTAARRTSLSYTSSNKLLPLTSFLPTKQMTIFITFNFDIMSLETKPHSHVSIPMHQQQQYGGKGNF